MHLENLKDLYEEQLAEIYQAEKESLEVLPVLRRSASTPELAAALDAELEHTREHVQQLERILPETRRATPSPFRSARALLRDCYKAGREWDAPPVVRDAALIATTQHLKHDEIAGYGCLRTWAQTLGYRDAAATLGQCLSDEKRCDTEFSRIAESINRRAAGILMATA